MKLIDADELLTDNTWEWFDEWGNCTAAGKVIMDAPTIDAEPVKHGEWETGLLREFRDTNIEAQEKADKAGYVRYVVNLKCSACGKITMVDNSIKYNFCPNCGAKMDG